MPITRQSRRGPHGRVLAWIRLALAVVALALAGCATQERAPERLPVSESTWWQVDNDITVASVAARGAAEAYAKGEMERWRGRVYDFTESAFIPWFSSFWTQQWLALKVAWYKLGGGDGIDPAVQRLAKYLQEQYREQVLVPVGKEFNPDAVRVQAARLYAERLGEGLHDLPQRHGVPSDQFDEHLAAIPAIAGAGSSEAAAYRASLLELVRADPVTRLPAFIRLLAEIQRAAGGEGAVPPEARISPMARRTSERLVARVVSGGGASAAAAAVGGVAGIAISLGALGVSAIAHANDAPEMEAQLRESFDLAADEMWLVLSEDPQVGVLAGVVHIAGQVEAHTATTIAQPVAEDPPIGERFVLDELVADEPAPANREPHDYDYDAIDPFGAVAE